MIPANFRFTTPKIALVIAAFIASYSAVSLALPSDKNETIRGSADNLTVDQKNGVATYTGTVKIEQGSLMISADSIVIHTNADSTVEKMIATGNPARFRLLSCIWRYRGVSCIRSLMTIPLVLAETQLPLDARHRPPLRACATRGNSLHRHPTQPSRTRVRD